jgi:hypothetical protein
VVHLLLHLLLSRLHRVLLLHRTRCCTRRQQVCRSMQRRLSARKSNVQGLLLHPRHRHVW